MRSRRTAVAVTLAATVITLLATSLALAIPLAETREFRTRPAPQNAASGESRRLAADNPNPPASPVKLIFVHHSTGGNWLADPNQDQPYGGLGRALMDNNYYVSATNYGWGPNAMGDRTDIPDWPAWFTGAQSGNILSRLYDENGQNIGDFGNWPRLAQNPGGENEIVMFKSCFPNSDLFGNPDDPPASQPSGQFTVSNAKAVYSDLLTYFRTRQDKLFIAITAPPMGQGAYSEDYQTPARRSANARALNDWLVNDWLRGYPHSNVAVFDYYNVLTSNGSASRMDNPATNLEPNDALWQSGNHHRWWNGAVQHAQTISNNYSAYPTDTYGDSHPTTAGHQKATAEFAQLLNVFYHRWKAGGVTRTRTPTPTRAGPPERDSLLYLPLITKRSPVPLATDTPTATATMAPTPSPSATPTTVVATGLLRPEDLVYQGAFRLPGDADRPRTFEYGGNAMTFNPHGDASGPADGFPGSLFIMGHDRMAYGEIPDGNQVAELSIPVPVVASRLSQLPVAGFLQGFHDVAAGYFTTMEEIPRVGMEYLDAAATGPQIHLGWGQHMPPDSAPATHGWFDPHLAAPNFQGTWFIGDQNFNSVNGYVFAIPGAWADAHTGGLPLATGRFRDGGWSGMGPALFAYRPWQADGSPPPSGTRLEETVLLLYQSTLDTPDIVGCLDGYQHPDEWEGGAWITTGSGKRAVLFAGTKATGMRYWYGWVNPAGPQVPCVETELISQFLVCRLADGTSCPPEDFAGCEGHNDYRGWWSTRFDSRFILYDPADLARVAAGQMQPWEPQPYASLDIDDRLFFNPPPWELDNLGTGPQRRFRIGAVAFDRSSGLLYVLEMFGDEAKPVAHVWRVQ